jgi:tetratricopeptide (TPR) repeat protein
MLASRNKKYLLSGRRGILSSGAVIIIVVAIIVMFSFVAFIFVRKAHSFLPSVSSLYSDWNAHSYEKLYNNSNLILAKRPLDGTALALNGFAAYYVYSEQTDPAAAQTYLNASIVSLRNAWYRVSDSEKPQIAYVLGKAYYQRGYYYADLSMKYLDYAYKAGFRNDDLAEFRGLAASLIGDYQTSIAAFTEALAAKPSDLLLFTLAKTWLKVNDTEKAKQYLYQTTQKTGDELLQLKCHYELGLILISENKLVEAQTEFNSILEKDPNSADAHYGLGVLYETQGDLVRARAEWRKAVKIDPVHAGARAKLEN